MRTIQCFLHHQDIMCYCLNPTGILHSKTYLYCGTNQVLNASENDLILYVCFSIKSENFYILTERPEHFTFAWMF